MHRNHLPSPSLCKVFELGVDRANQVECPRPVRGLKTPNSMGKVSTAEVLRLRATSAVSRDPSVRRSAQDDESVGG